MESNLFILPYDPLSHALSQIPDISIYAFADDLAIATHDITHITLICCVLMSFLICLVLALTGINHWFFLQHTPAKILLSG